MIMQQQVANRGTQIDLRGVPPVPAQTARLVASVPQREFDWLHFAARAGTNGHEWVSIYRSHAATVGLTQKALQLMWRDQLEQGRELLQQFTRAVQDVAISPPSVAAAMQRLYYGSEAYYFYAVGRFDESYASLDSAHESVVMAISSADFLRMLAMDCAQLCLHRARVARNQRRWSSMHNYLDQARMMVLDRLPLCRTLAGEPVYFGDLEAFYRSRTVLSAEEDAWLRKLTDRNERSTLLDRFVRTIFRMEHFGIDYE